VLGRTDIVKCPQPRIFLGKIGGMERIGTLSHSLLEGRRRERCVGLRSLSILVDTT